MDKGIVAPLRDDSPAPVSGLWVVGRHVDENPPRPAKRPASTGLSAGIQSSGMRIGAPPKPPGGRPITRWTRAALLHRIRTPAQLDASIPRAHGLYRQVGGDGREERRQVTGVEHAAQAQGGDAVVDYRNRLRRRADSARGPHTPVGWGRAQVGQERVSAWRWR